MRKTGCLIFFLCMYGYAIPKIPIVFSLFRENPYTGWKIENLQGEVERMTTSTGKEVCFDRNGHIVRFSDTYCSYTHEFIYDDPLRYHTGIRQMEITFPDKYPRTRVDRGYDEYEKSSVFHVYMFDEAGRIEHILLSEIYTELQIAYAYGEYAHFPVKRELNYSNEAGEWTEEQQYIYLSFDQQGNWTERSVSGWRGEAGDNEPQHYTYTESASYVYFTTEANATDALSDRDTDLIPDFFSYIPDDSEGIVETSEAGVFRSFDFSYQFGWTLFFLIPRQDPESWVREQFLSIPGDDEDEKFTILLDHLNKRSFRELSENLDIYAWHVAPEYLLYFPSGDLPFERNTQVPWEEVIYFLNYETGEIVIEETFTIQPSRERQPPVGYTWMEDFLQKRQALRE